MTIRGRLAWSRTLGPGTLLGGCRPCPDLGWDMTRPAAGESAVGTSASLSFPWEARLMTASRGVSRVPRHVSSALGQGLQASCGGRVGCMCKPRVKLWGTENRA